MTKEAVWRCELAASGIVLFVGLAIAFSTLSRGVWLDEFFTYSITARSVTGREFLAAMIGEPAPLLHNGLVFLGQAIGLTTFAALRSLNILGVVLVFGALCFGFRRSVVTWKAACVIVVMFIASPIFLDYFAELRAYALLYSSSIAAILAWMVVERGAALGQVDLSDLLVYGACLAVFVNLHYFATVLGGLLALALIIQAAARGFAKIAAQIALVSLVAALPALAMAGAQVRGGLTSSFDDWITGNTAFAVRTMIRVAYYSVGRNLVAIAFGAVGLLFSLRDRARRDDLRGPAILGATVTLFLGIVLVFNARQPIVVARYLFATGGAFVVGLALLCGRREIPWWSTLAICVFALASQLNDIRTEQFRRDGWRTSAQWVANRVTSCPTTHVFADPFVYQNVTDGEARLWRDGYRYYANEFHFTTDEIGRGASVAGSGSCPSLIWLEHVFHVQGFPLDRLVAELAIGIRGHAEVEYVGSGAVIVVQ